VIARVSCKRRRLIAFSLGKRTDLAFRNQTHAAAQHSNAPQYAAAGTVMGGLHDYHASVTTNGTTSSMVAAQATGDCMSCHTQAGANGAPGRILAP
jgi:Tfp pilus assembly protein PilV